MAAPTTTTFIDSSADLLGEVSQSAKTASGNRHKFKCSLCRRPGSEKRREFSSIVTLINHQKTECPLGVEWYAGHTDAVTADGFPVSEVVQCSDCLLLFSTSSGLRNHKILSHKFPTLTQQEKMENRRKQRQSLKLPSLSVSQTVLPETPESQTLSSSSPSTGRAASSTARTGLKRSSARIKVEEQFEPVDGPNEIIPEDLSLLDFKKTRLSIARQNDDGDEDDGGFEDPLAQLDRCKENQQQQQLPPQQQDEEDEDIFGGTATTESGSDVVDLSGGSGVTPVNPPHQQPPSPILPLMPLRYVGGRVKTIEEMTPFKAKTFVGKIQEYLENVVPGDVKQGAKFPFEVRQVSCVPKKGEVSRLLQKMLQLPQPYVEFTSRTIFLLEKNLAAAHPDRPVIVFALFAQECPDKRLAFISHFGAPSHLPEINNNVHADLFGNVLTGYLAALRDDGFEQVYLSTQHIENSTSTDPIFHRLIPSTKNLIQNQNLNYFPTDWLITTLDEASQAAIISGFETILQRCDDPAYRPPVFVDTTKFSQWPLWVEHFEDEVAQLLTSSAANAAFTRPPIDSILLKLMFDYRFLLINLATLGRTAVRQYPGGNYMPTPSYLANAAQFKTKCGQQNWRFGTMTEALRSTEAIFRHLEAVRAEIDISHC